MNEHRLAGWRGLSVILVLLLACPAGGALLRVPLDLPDLPAALTVSQDGDTVAVATSFVVAGGVTIPGRAIAVIGGWDDAFALPGGLTLVSGDPTAPALRIAPPETGSPHVAGFRIVGGGGAERTSPVPGRYGGGLLVEGGAPVLRDLVISGGQVGDGAVLGLGGGLALLATAATVTNVTVEDCRAAWGAGVFIDAGSPQLTGCNIRDNTCLTAPGGEVALGAGICVRRASARLVACTISGGRGAIRGGGIAWLGQRQRTLELVDCLVLDNTFAQDGGGLWGELGTVVITGGRFAQNRPAPDAPYTSGGGLYLTGAAVVLEDAVLAHNRADAGGGATINAAATADVRGSVFHANESTFFGAALNYQSNSAGAITGNTLAANVNLDTGAGALQLVASAPTVSHNLVAFNTGGGVVLAGGSATFTCNNVFGNSGADWSGTPDPTGQDGNLAVDPLFCDLAGGELTLDADSPCLEAPGCGLIGALGIGCGGSTAAPDLARAGRSVTLDAFPNPANPRLTLRGDLPVTGHARVTVHDARGRLVRTLLAAESPAGPLHVDWDGRGQDGREVGSGVYLVRLATATGTATSRVTLLR
jgi:hypothetical protein